MALVYAVKLKEATKVKGMDGRVHAFPKGKDLILRKMKESEGTIVNVICPLCGFQDSVLNGSGDTVCSNCGAVIY